MQAWEAIIPLVLALPQHGRLRVQRARLPHPREAGFYRSTGLNLRARAHYRRALRDGRGLHVHEHDGHYEVHWDRWDPSVSFLRHLVHDVGHALKRRLRREPVPPAAATATAAAA